MNERSLLLALCWALLFQFVPAEAGKAGPDARRGLGHAVSAPGTLILCEGSSKVCRVAKAQQILLAEDLVLALPGFRGEVDAVKGAVRLSLLGMLPERPDDTARESVLRLHDNGAFDLTFTLERGRVLLTRQSKRDPVKVQVRFLRNVLTLELTEPDTVVALESYSRWPQGAPFLKEPKDEHQPLVDVLLFLVKGEVTARLNKEPEQALKGKVVYHWNSLRDPLGPLPVRELPAWTTGETVPPEKPLRVALDRFRQRLAKTSLSAALQGALQDKDTAQGALAAYAAGAVDDLPALLKVLDGGKQATVRRAAVLALRHWSGRSATHSIRLYETLLANKYAPGQAEIVMTLLQGFEGAALGRPETYAVLIDYLGHNRAAVRELAAGQLYRLAPAGKTIPYDAGGSPEEHTRAQAAWRKLIPRGQLPPSNSPKQP
ncbi:MAG TPA: hypothetical protein VEL76_15530 [Gemmataceae bacterium]|nr:hypothetical protein [Gemmataceae bacterium]